jgi:hypothetical protein
MASHASQSRPFLQVRPALSRLRADATNRPRPSGCPGVVPTGRRLALRSCKPHGSGVSLNQVNGVPIREPAARAREGLTKRLESGLIRRSRSVSRADVVRGLADACHDSGSLRGFFQRSAGTRMRNSRPQLAIRGESRMSIGIDRGCAGRLSWSLRSSLPPIEADKVVSLVTSNPDSGRSYTA